jgi:exodeoxyribonuclease VII small subunit
MGIDEGVKLFDEGVKLSKECYEILHATKGKINIIKQELNEVVEKPFKQ